MENGEMKDRIKELMVSQHMTQQSFAQMLGISPASLSSIFQARTRPTLTHVDAIERCFPNINLMWLIYGRGPMFATGDPTTLSTDDSKPKELPEAQSDFSIQPALHFTDEPSPTPQPAQPMSQNSAPVREKEIIKYIDKPQRRITEIRIFYDDQTWETFIPKK